MTPDNLRTYLLNFPEIAGRLTEQDRVAWIKRWDKDSDCGLAFFDLVKALQTMTPYKR